ncbi:MAG: hypothetical protein JST54_28875 [Deltaproteobacteria bacterium]|nr:hypothetical protein [Deltaproteobacteria bacterium]
MSPPSAQPPSNGGTTWGMLVMHWQYGHVEPPVLPLVEDVLVLAPVELPDPLSDEDELLPVPEVAPDPFVDAAELEVVDAVPPEDMVAPSPADEVLPVELVDPVTECPQASATAGSDTRTARRIFFRKVRKASPHGEICSRDRGSAAECNMASASFRIFSRLRNARTPVSP